MHKIKWEECGCFCELIINAVALEGALSKFCPTQGSKTLTCARVAFQDHYMQWGQKPSATRDRY